MSRVRKILAIITILLFVLLCSMLINNPVFAVDIVKSIDNTRIELTVTGLLIVILFWAGVEVNNRAIQNYETGDKSYLELPGSGLLFLRSEENPLFSFWQGISTELFGAVITTLLLGMVVLVFQQYQGIQSDKEDIILQMRSPNNGFALNAVNTLRGQNWHMDGTLNWRDLSEANLKDAPLQFSSLVGVDFSDSDLSNTDFQGANLTNANFDGSILSGAIFVDATLSGASFANTQFDELTKLPDGSNWNESLDLLQYVDLSYTGHITKTPIEDTPTKTPVLTLTIETPTLESLCLGTIPGAGGMLNQVRIVPNPSSPSRTPIQRGSTVVILDTVEDFGITWYQIEYGNETGWISGEYVDVQSECR